MKTQKKVNYTLCIFFVIYAIILLLNLCGTISELACVLTGLALLTVYLYVRFKFYNSKLALILFWGIIFSLILYFLTYNIFSKNEMSLYIGFCFITSLGYVGCIYKMDLYKFFWLVNYIGSMPMIFYYSRYYNIYAFIALIVLVNVINFFIFRDFKKKYKESC